MTESFKKYLGDSVYIELENGMAKLTTNNGYADDPRNIIYMEIEVVEAFLNWLKMLERRRKDEQPDSAISLSEEVERD
jgi:hypothetical protein